MDLLAFIEKLKKTPELVQFRETIEVIDTQYDFVETEFTNHLIHNAAGQNNGSCKIFSFGKLNKLTKDETLACFGDYYREDVLKNPNGEDHQNIRNFILAGWDGISFAQSALRLRG
ncbi:MAG: HopJ type III effector protein [Cellvibrio sp.]